MMDTASVVQWVGLEVARATLLLAGVAAVAAWLRRASAAVRHLVWGAGVVGLLVLPLFAAVTPLRWSLLPAAQVADAAQLVERVPAGAPVAAAPAVVESRAQDAVASRPLSAAGVRGESRSAARAWVWVREHALALLIGVWAAGVVALLLRAGIGAAVLARALRGARVLDDAGWRAPLYEGADRLDLPSVPRLVQSARMPMPFVTGLVRPMIVLPESATTWTEERRRAVLLHELAHVRRRDLVVNAFARLAAALWWFHPLARVAARRLRAESERACDDLVLGVGTRASSYADHLLQIVRDAGRAAMPAAALPMAQRHEFEGRMLAILEADARREPPRRRHAALALIAFAVLLVPLAGVGPARVAAASPVQPPESTDPDLVVTEPEVVDEDVGAVASPGRGVTVEDTNAAPPPLPAETRVAAQQDTGVAGALRAALRDESAAVRREAAWAMGSLRVTSAVPDLVAMVGREPDAEVRKLAIWSLVNLGDASVTGTLARVAREDADAEAREMAVWGLGQFRDAATLPALTAALRDADEEVRSIAAWALGQLRPETAPAELLAALRDDSGDVREHAAWAVGQIRDPAAMDALVGMIGDDEAGEVALWAIGNIGGEAAQPALMEALRSGSPDVRAAAARALAGHGGSHPWPWPWPRPMVRH